MPRKPVRNFWRGLDLNRATSDPGFSVVAKNLHMNRVGSVDSRGGIMRVWDTRPANAVVHNLFEYVNAAGTTIRIAKIGTVLYSFTLTAGTALTSLETGLSSSGRADICEMQHLILAADQKAKNYVSIGTSGANDVLTLDKAAPTSALSPAGAGTATGMVAGTYRVAYSWYSPTYDWITPPRAYESVTITADQAIRLTMPASPGDSFTTMYFWRSKVGETGPFYWVASHTTFSGTFDLTVLDTDITALPATYYLSPVHNSTTGEITGAVVPACKFSCPIKHRLALGSSTSNPLRIFFSDLDKPTQFFTTGLAKSPSHYHDLDAGMGRTMTGLNEFDSALVCFKEASITVRNGDISVDSWQWFVAVEGIGCVAPWSRAVAPGIGVFYAGEAGVYLFNLRTNRKISDREDGSGIGDTYRALDITKREFWWSAWDEVNREYLLGVTTSSATGNTPDVFYAYCPDTDSWTGPHDVGMGLMLASCAGLVTNGSSAKRIYLGSSDGYAYETHRSTQTDGPISGTVTGTATAGAGTTLTDSTAAFYTTNDGLTGMVITVRHSASSYESRVIASNTGTVITVSSAWTSNPTAGERYFIGAIRNTLALSQWDAENAGEKTWHRINLTWTKQTHTTPVRVGFTLDDGSVPTYHGTENTMGDVRSSVGVDDRAVELGAYVDIIGTSSPFEIKGVEYDLSGGESRGPAA